ncbi:MAG: hypothetical protein FIB07_01280 [Candidatus Methanoperedens sp.]|nr:hypothetical protein [Candidatus Methanoperedens sp.]
MDRLLGGIIDDLTLYRIIEGAIIISTLFAVFLSIQIVLVWKFINKEEANSDEIISNKKSFYRSSIFIFMAGFFMIIHEFLEGLEENAPDYTTYKLFEFIAISGLILFMLEWYKILKKLQKKQKAQYHTI